MLLSLHYCKQNNRIHKFLSRGRSPGILVQNLQRKMEGSH